jgi:hypothetical protein
VTGEFLRGSSIYSSGGDKIATSKIGLLVQQIWLIKLLMQPSKMSAR